MKNNIFSFAPSELTQDAMICWCVNWINDKSSKLYPMTVEILRLFGVKDKLDKIDLEIFQQKFKIDVLLSLKGENKVIIIEDKTYSSEHHNQIAVYRDKILTSAKDPYNEFGIDNNVEITTVYLKTGFFYDNDKKVKSDIVVQSEDLIKIIEKYCGENVMLNDYYEYLMDVQEWYIKSGEYNKIAGEDFWDWNISRFHIAQYNLMREIFPEDKWDKSSSLYEVRHGSNIGGRPWSELNIMSCRIAGKSEDEYNIFWRVDTDSDGPYISLRFYDRYDKKNEQEKKEHLEIYYKHRNHIENVITTDSSIHWKWEDLKGGFTANYFEATLITIQLKDVLKNWESESQRVISTLRRITEKFIEANIVE